MILVESVLEFAVDTSVTQFVIQGSLSLAPESQLSFKESFKSFRSQDEYHDDLVDFNITTQFFSISKDLRRHVKM